MHVGLAGTGTSAHGQISLQDQDKYLKEVKTIVVAIRDELFVRMTDVETGALFAECPLPSDGTSLTTAVEPVVDSSCYFVVRVVDKETNNHAFIGLGFRWAYLTS